MNPKGWKIIEIGGKTLFNHYFNGGFSAHIRLKSATIRLSSSPMHKPWPAENKYVLVQIKTCVNLAKENFA